MLLSQLIESVIVSYKYSNKQQDNLVLSKTWGIFVVTDFIYTKECVSKTVVMPFYCHG